MGSWKRVSRAADDFIRKLLCVDVSVRMTAEQALQHEFIVGRSDLAKEAVNAKVDGESLKSLIEFSHASKFRRACMSCMAWSLTNEQRIELREAFLAMDTDKKGSITLGEFKKALEERFDFDETEIKQIFDAVDTSHTEEIAYTEFLAAMMSSRVALHDDLLKATFLRFDTGNTGYIEASDLKQILGETFEGEEIEKLIKEADTNGDGKISYDEFIHYAKTAMIIATKSQRSGTRLLTMR